MKQTDNFLLEQSFFTPKVLANSSPGLSFGNPGIKFGSSSQPRRGSPHQVDHGATNPFRVTPAITYLSPGLPKLNPGLELANTFGVIVKALSQGPA